MTRQDMRRLIAAHDTVWEGWWPALLALPRRDAHRRLGGSFPSVFAMAKHMVEAEVYWQDCLEAAPDLTLALRSRTMRDLEPVWHALQIRRAAWLRTADPKHPVDFEADSGAMARVTAWECLIHVTTHAHFHRGQLANHWRQLGRLRPRAISSAGSSASTER